jgi:hypothetical protein
MLKDADGPVSVQVKLQRSEKGTPVERDGKRFGFPGLVYMTETQKTRGGTDGADNKTRPYRFGEFDVLAVSMQPSTGRWDRYMYTVGRWLIAGKEASEIAVMQPVTMDRSDFWTTDFTEAAHWFRQVKNFKRMTSVRPTRASKTRWQVSVSRTSHLVQPCSFEVSHSPRVGSLRQAMTRASAPGTKPANQQAQRGECTKTVTRSLE